MPEPAGAFIGFLTAVDCRGTGNCTAVGNTILPGDAGTLTTLAEHR